LIDAQAVAVRIADEVLAFDEALPTQGVEKRDVSRRVARTELQTAEAIGAACFLRACRAGHSSWRGLRTEEAIVVATGAPREAGCPPWVVLGVKAIEAPAVRRRVMSGDSGQAPAGLPVCRARSVHLAARRKIAA
jgi:hypothetical protein